MPSGFVGRADIIAFGKHNIVLFLQMGMLENGVPSERPLARVDNGINTAGRPIGDAGIVEVFHAQVAGFRSWRGDNL